MHDFFLTADAVSHRECGQLGFGLEFFLPCRLTQLTLPRAGRMTMIPTKRRRHSSRLRL